MYPAEKYMPRINNNTDITDDMKFIPLTNNFGGSYINEFNMRQNHATGSNTGMPGSSTDMTGGMPSSNTGMPDSNTGMTGSNTGMPGPNTGMTGPNTSITGSNTDMTSTNMTPSNIMYSNMIPKGWIPVYFYSPYISFPSQMPFSQINPMQNVNMPSSGMQQPNALLEEELFSYNVPSNVNRQDSETMLDLLKNYDLDIDVNVDLVRNCSNNVDEIFSDLEKNNSGIFSILQAYNIPYPMLKLLVRRVIKHTIDFCNKGGS